ncbi:MAG: T9SS type A sorting domain-containing protein, partial [Salibacteraceae bacterium]
PIYLGCGALANINNMKRLSIILTLLVATTLFGQNANISNGVVFDGEPFLAINPNDSKHLVVAWMGWINISQQIKIKTRASFDGGQSWSAITTLPHVVNGYTSADPSIAFNSNGDVFVSYIDFDGIDPPVNGGVYICKSSNGGLNWATPNEVINANFDGTKWPIDRPWMVIDKSNSTNEGNIYITTFNGNRTNPSFNPYLSVSIDSGSTFTTSFVDTAGWLAGNINPYPMCSPAVSKSGVFYGAYPSYVLSQSLFAQLFLATSTDAGISKNYKIIKTYKTPTNNDDYPAAKKGSLLLCNPSNENHLVNIYLSAELGDLDIYLIESFDKGSNWSSSIRLNDDPISNNRMQDLIWGDFDQDGDLIVSWRDRRNGADSTYQTNSEIWAVYRNKDSINFESNFKVSSQIVAYDSVLENSGNDFMCIKLQDDTLNAVWGDTRTGKLNIWFQRMNTKGTVLTRNQISSEEIPRIKIYPNPASSVLRIDGESILDVTIYDMNQKAVLIKKYSNQKNNVEINLDDLIVGTYLIYVRTSKGNFSDRFIKH